MADTVYCVVRTDNMSGTDQRADLLSVRYYSDGDSEQAEVENGVIAEVVKLEDGEREIYKAKPATSSSKLNDCVLLAAPEVMYDERLRNLEDYINEKGKAIRGYILRSRNFFSVTKEGFESATLPTVDQTVGIGEGGKIKAGGTGLGKCVAIEPAGKRTFYVIQIGVTESDSAPVI